MSIFSPYGLQRGRGRSIHGRQRNEPSSTRSRRQKSGQSYISDADKEGATFYSMGVSQSTKCINGLDIVSSHYCRVSIIRF